MSSVAATYDWPVVTAGDQAITTFVFWDDEEQTVPSDLTALSFRSEVRPVRGESASITAAAEIGCSTLDNTLTLVLSSEQTRTLGDRGRRFFYDIEEASASGAVTTIIEGYIRVKQDVTR